ncbi:TfoX/Sxy family DNA transformation protein [Kluyvera ascorbata]|uniref:TfoX/Sxy family DNA transformation protein n=1 Tax=Kluyvera ascorbata TaxID=51288 RepID=A0AB35X8G7_9ENTR|nr:TfoX/Sxy family DNA transformation protein [Kluyvera ascorbata]BBV66760.1 competence protein [Klebsiella sp. STW0522-44]HEB4872189.1 TfoX/Sxy family DNA transformation protein [Kluyvera ascorbata F0526]EJG2385245.1 TfoX/Sxy family DNA transformation protein [Kluyvera ascorbata]KFD07180.1 DNA transformation protein [Kluyvera ascorbata ATCC 33433]MDT8700233.1 TfoX/Sxy family DNA transformation protein [Kluyvera ascorbata]
MKKISYKRIYQSQKYFSLLGKIKSRALFGGYSLAVNDAVFAMVSEGELYLRMCEESATYQAQHSPPLLTLRKRGCSQQLKYFHVGERLWSDEPVLLQLGKFSLEDALREKKQQKSLRIKDLPNLSFHMELLLSEAGIKDAQMLQHLGAEMAWIRLRKIRKQLSINVLYSLEGAIMGVHSAALPAQRRQELQEWALAHVKTEGVRP